jgi:hypothetical protein
MGTSSVSDSVEDEAGDAGSRGEFMAGRWRTGGGPRVEGLCRTDASRNGLLH